MKLLAFHTKDVDGAKFKIGDVVRIQMRADKQTHHNPPARSIITAVNKVDDGEYEYSVDNFSFLLWEDELVGE